MIVDCLPRGPTRGVPSRYLIDSTTTASVEWNEVVIMTTTVTEAPERHRYEISVDGAPAGFTTFTIDGDVAILSHTKIDREYEGRGLASALIGSALDDLRERGLTVVPRCPFVRTFIDEHPEYQDLLSAR
jgi:uncharacterized protein